jgi:hypothetical protein
VPELRNLLEELNSQVAARQMPMPGMVLANEIA